MIKGIGPIYARKLVKAFRDQVFDIIAQQPRCLQELSYLALVRSLNIGKWSTSVGRFHRMRGPCSRHSAIGDRLLSPRRHSSSFNQLNTINIGRRRRPLG